MKIMHNFFTSILKFIMTTVTRGTENINTMKIS